MTATPCPYTILNLTLLSDGKMERDERFGEMIDLLELQKEFILRHLGAGDVAVDFTAGNGHDTSFLSRTVGKDGRVYAFDIQPQALASARATLIADGCPDNVTLILDSHSNVSLYVHEKINAGMFNLGFLPGGDRTKTTMRVTTLPAVRAAIELLAPGGILSVAVYPGHEEGDAEGRELRQYYETLDRKLLCATEIHIVNSPTSPYFTIIEKRK